MPARWTVAHVPGEGAWRRSTAIRVRGFSELAPEVDDPSVFEISPDAGLVLGPTVSVVAAVAAPPRDYNRKYVYATFLLLLALFVMVMSMAVAVL